MNPRVPSPDEPLEIALPVRGRVTVRTFPHDGRFERDIRRAVLAVGNAASSEADLRELLQGALRAWYPRVEVRAREGLASLSEEDRVWYVMRDGQLHKAREQRDRLYAALSDARATTAESDVAVERAHATMAFASQPRARRGRTGTAAAMAEDPMQ